MAIVKARAGQTGPLDSSASGAVHEHKKRILESHTLAITAFKETRLPFEPKDYYTHVFNGISGTVSMKDVEALSNLPQVERVYYDYQVHVTLGESVPLIGAFQVWLLEDPSGQAVTGKEITVAVVDTGVDYTHADLGGCLGASCRVIGGYDFVNNDADPMDDMGHGTHVAGIVGASGITTGVAPDVSFLAYKVLNEFGSGSFSDVIAGIERATDPDGNPNTDDSADVINLSLGGGGDPDDPVSQAVDAAVGLGVAAVVSAGNSGCVAPGTSPSAHLVWPERPSAWAPPITPMLSRPSAPGVRSPVSGPSSPISSPRVSASSRRSPRWARWETQRDTEGSVARVWPRLTWQGRRRSSSSFIQPGLRR